MPLDSFATRSLRRADAQAEQLIGVTRVAVAAVLLVFMGFVVRRTQIPAAVGQSGLVLSVTIMTTYFLIGVVSIAVVRAGVHKPWMSWAFGISDVLLVLGNMYFTSDIRGTNPSIALASPAAFFAILVFVSQLFRVRLRLQIVLTLCLLIGLLALTLAAPDTLLSPLDKAFLIENYERQPNIARLVIVAMIGAVCIVAVWRTRRMVHDIAHKSEQTRNASRFLPSELRGDLTDERLHQLQQGRSVDVVVMFVDIRGFTLQSEKIGPRDTTKLLSGFREFVLSSMQNHGGVVDKFIGDGALLVFGLNDPVGVAAQNALQAATELSTAITAWSLQRTAAGDHPVDVVICLHAGTVIAGAIGGARHLEFGVFGSVVNEASRIEGLAKQQDMHIVASEPVFAAANLSPTGWHDFGKTVLRGSADPVRLFGKDPAPATH
ncbi:Adenylate cyclase 1 [Shimia sp. SK013]|uniref:adenylate/guanylate cyclase domain-containing protein n=1 Tax=Shimia sp. SK013 TaxID=1389006 RepID=UPI0006B4BB6C|nr:adenylate/guanylate cyclase domain-containing protein [Shimia sp. SK013]KPA21385.1 Adenylate cyclase 1 [Shimia sp. SK013]